MIDTPVVLETERLRLRAPALSDAPAVVALAGDRRIAATTLNIPHPYPESSAIEFLRVVIERRAESKDYTFALVRKQDDAFVGLMGLHPRLDFRAEAGYWLGVPFWNQGYATEALKRVIQFGFEGLGWQRIEATHFLHNPASGRVMQKAGMTFEGTKRQHILKWGQFIDLSGYSILRSEFEAHRR